MVRQRETLRSKRINDRIIDELRANVHAGIPWRQPLPQSSEERGYGDLIFLVTGHFYRIACEFIKSKDARETMTELWSALREDIIDEHIKHEPGTRPWCWWKEDREQRRVVGIDKIMIPHNGGNIYESESEYLERHKLLTKEEKKAAKD